jgi:type VI protein secretion system component VasF
MILSFTVSTVTIFFDLVIQGDFNDLFVRLILALCLTLFVVVYSLWRLFLSKMADELSQEAT